MKDSKFTILSRGQAFIKRIKYKVWQKSTANNIMLMVRINYVDSNIFSYQRDYTIIYVLYKEIVELIK